MCVLDFVVPRYSWSRAGNAIIILGDYRFKKRSKHINQKQETHWVCNKCDKGCKAKLTTLNDAIIKMYNVHKHDGSRKLKWPISWLRQMILAVSAATIRLLFVLIDILTIYSIEFNEKSGTLVKVLVQFYSTFNVCI